MSSVFWSTCLDVRMVASGRRIFYMPSSSFALHFLPKVHTMFLSQKRNGPFHHKNFDPP
ncbi:unnamed protein product [Ectocarpus sp. 8 AP-2014]